MKMHRVLAVVMRYFRPFFHDYNRILAIFYWPVLEILIWGFVGIWVQSWQNNDTAMREALLMGAVLWQLLDRPCFEVGYTMLEEMWSGSIVNVFGSPLQLREWIFAVIVLVAIMSCAFGFYYAGLVWLLYNIPFMHALKIIALFGPSLFVASIWLGFVGLSLVTLFGRTAQEFVFVMRWVFAPFSGVYYPVDVLPFWCQKFAYCLPMTYAFEGMRFAILGTGDPLRSMATSLMLGLCYAGFALLFFSYAFNKSKQAGLSRLVA